MNTNNNDNASMVKTDAIITGVKKKLILIIYVNIVIISVKWIQQWDQKIIIHIKLA